LRRADSGVTPHTVYLHGRKNRNQPAHRTGNLEALREIAAGQSMSISKLVTAIAANRDTDSNLGFAVRVYIVQYYRELLRR